MEGAGFSGDASAGNDLMTHMLGPSEQRPICAHAAAVSQWFMGQPVKRLTL